VRLQNDGTRSDRRHRLYDGEKKKELGVSQIPGARAAKSIQVIGTQLATLKSPPVSFTEWTVDGILRHPRFVALREDKSPSEIVLDRPGAVA
jgi:ATP-dependent DNA ligase